jgi:hypothetical protein
MSGSLPAWQPAWRAALAAEHQAVFGYALLGPRLPGPDQQLAISASDAHEALRDATQAALDRAGVPSVAPLADYPALYPVANPAHARALAIRLEDACAAAWRYLYLQAASLAERQSTALRAPAQSALTASAIRAAQWRARVTPAQPTQPFPGT